MRNYKLQDNLDIHKIAHYGIELTPHFSNSSDSDEELGEDGHCNK